eukprot:m.19203 g.19203  ORF g.19203 m.19203 type:complete len:123 (-) comp11731_c0_seq1:1083-1451(-)
MVTTKECIQVGRSAIPANMKKTLSERQFFTKFEHADTYDDGFSDLFVAMEHGKASWGLKHIEAPAPLLEGKPAIFTPPSHAASVPVSPAAKYWKAMATVLPGIPFRGDFAAPDCEARLCCLR